jgi:predicted MPP superfamily phosphohydrolase
LPNPGKPEQISSQVRSRRQFLIAAAALGSAGALGTVAGASLLESRQIGVKRYEVHLARLSAKLDGFRVAQLSDLHYDLSYTAELVETAVQTVKGLNPDLVVLTGDYVSAFARHHTAAAESAESCALALSGLRPPFGILAVLGNHDHLTDPRAVTRSLQSRGITVLDNQSQPIESEGSRLWVVGVDDVLKGHPDLDSALQRVPRDAATILLVHEPDYADDVHHPVGLQLSGHSHGGQIRLPLIGPPYLPQLARKYPEGFRWVGSLALNTNCGIGMSLLPIRLNCPPEITLLTLRSGPS